MVIFRNYVKVYQRVTFSCFIHLKKTMWETLPHSIWGCFYKSHPLDSCFSGNKNIPLIFFLCLDSPKIVWWFPWTKLGKLKNSSANSRSLNSNAMTLRHRSHANEDHRQDRENTRTNKTWDGFPGSWMITISPLLPRVVLAPKKNPPTNSLAEKKMPWRF